MAKNQPFERTYIIRMKGKTTNNFMTTHFDALFTKLVESINALYKSLNAAIVIRKGEDEAL